MKRSSIKIKQHDITDSGAACLSSVATHYRLKFPIARIRQEAFAGQKSVSVSAMIEAAKKMGLEAKDVKGSLVCLTDSPKPAVAYMIAKEVLHHFVVIYQVTKKYVRLMDPSDGKMHKKSHEDFNKEWTGVLILLRPLDTHNTAQVKKTIFQGLVDVLIRAFK